MEKERAAEKVQLNIRKVSVTNFLDRLKGIYKINGIFKAPYWSYKNERSQQQGTRLQHLTDDMLYFAAIAVGMKNSNLTEYYPPQYLDIINIPTLPSNGIAIAVPQIFLP